MTITRRTFLTATAATAAGAVVVGFPSTSSAAPAAARSGPLTNLAHLRWLLDEVHLAASSTHTTIDIASSPTGLAPWTYANALSSGGFARVGGGNLDPATGDWSQGAYNADDIARAAVVFLRAADQGAGGASARGGALAEARGLLRTLTYLQDADGPRAGNVVLWMQADGTFNLTPQPPDSPNPSDAAESYWLARTLWAVGEGYATFQQRDPAFAAFLRDRLHLGLDALDRGCLSHYGQWLVADDVRVPGWLITGGADATAEACLGLAAYVKAAPEDARARTALARLAEGVAAMRSGGTGVWPFGAILPWTLSQSFWHAWGGEAPQALCRTAGVLGDRTLRAAGLSDAGSFTPQVLTSGGPHNAWATVPAEAQIAYGAEGRVSGVLAAADLTGSEGFLDLAGLAGGWFFGANLSGRAVYDPATGVTFDGVETDGRVNANSGAESTIHGQLAMLALDAHPVAGALAASISGYAFHGLSVVEAEGGVLAGGATVVRPPSAWTGAANWSGGAYVMVPAGGSLVLAVGGHDGDLVHPIVNRRPGDLGTSTYWALDARGRRTLLGRLANGGLRDTGVVQADGLLKPFALDRALPDGSVSVVVESTGDLQLDALLMQPVVSTVVYARGGGTPAVLYANARTIPANVPALAAGTGWTWTADGTRRGAVRGPRVLVTGGGFAITT
ncbi:MAG: twin-arginine translocation signal domain-containing protein [Lapillicoccus sp.]